MIYHDGYDDIILRAGLAVGRKSPLHNSDNYSALTSFPHRHPSSFINTPSAMRASALRLTRQQLLFSSRRYASTSTNTAAKAASNASNTAATSARDTATKAAGKAMEILGKSGETFANIAAKTGGRTGQALKAVQCE